MNNFDWIVEDRFASEEGLYWAYTTDVKTNIDPQDIKINSFQHGF